MAALPSFPAGAGLRVTVNATSAADALAQIAARLEQGRGFVLATLNLDHLVKLRSDAMFRRAYLAADIVTADGNPVVWLSRLAGRRVALTPGSDLVAPMAAAAARLDAPLALYGASPEALAETAARLVALNPGLRVVLTLSPPHGFDPAGRRAQADARRIVESGARLCLVALGAPRQEIFMAAAHAAAPHCGFAGVGAGLDFIAGAQTRAPVLVRRLALEWAWRLALQPRRLGRRYLDCALLLPALLVDAARQRHAAS